MILFDSLKNAGRGIQVNVGRENAHKSELKRGVGGVPDARGAEASHQIHPNAVRVFIQAFCDQLFGKTHGRAHGAHGVG